MGGRPVKRQVRSAVMLSAMLLALGVGTWNGAPPHELGPSVKEQIAADAELHKAIRATRAEPTGEFSIQPVGVKGSYDLDARRSQSDTEYYEEEGGEERYYLFRVIQVDGTLYVKTDYSDGDECWQDATGMVDPGFGADGLELFSLLDALQANSESKRTFSATAPVGALGDALFGGDFTKPDSERDEPGSPRAARVPVEVRTTSGTIRSITIDIKGMFKALADQKVRAAEAFADGGDVPYLKDLDEVRIMISGFGFPQTIERPAPWDIAIDEDEKC